MRAAQRMLADKINWNCRDQSFSRMAETLDIHLNQFIDGWNGGAATAELIGALRTTMLPVRPTAPDVYVVADLAGTASLAATAEDLIPSAHFMYHQRHNLVEIANGKNFQLRSVIFCTEDSIHLER